MAKGFQLPQISTFAKAGQLITIILMVDNAQPHCNSKWRLLF